MNAQHWRVDESFRHPMIPAAQLSQKAFCNAELVLLSARIV